MSDLSAENNRDPPHIFVTQWFYAVVLGVVLIPVVIKKELAELKIVALSLFLMVCVFVLMLFAQLCYADTSLTNPDPKEDYKYNYYSPKK